MSARNRPENKAARRHERKLRKALPRHRVAGIAHRTEHPLKGFDRFNPAHIVPALQLYAEKRLPRRIARALKAAGLVPAKAKLRARIRALRGLPEAPASAAPKLGRLRRAA